MKRKAFTLIELLVVVAIIALLVSILLPALGRARELAKRVQDSAQLSGIGKAMALYQNDFSEANPTICTSNTIGPPAADAWFGSSYYNVIGSPTAKKRWYLYTWAGDPTASNYDSLLATQWGKYATVGGCLYLLVKYEDLIPKMFLCPSAPSDREMNLSDATAQDSTNIKNWTNLRDFCSMYNLSYSYHDPFKNPSGASSSSALAVLADKNPFFDNQTDNGLGSVNTAAGDAGTPTKTKTTNSLNHNQDGQNVLYAGSNVKFETLPNVGIGSDNIYTRWDVADTATPTTDDQKQVGKKVTAAVKYADLSHSTEDAYLGN